MNHDTRSCSGGGCRSNTKSMWLSTMAGIAAGFAVLIGLGLATDAIGGNAVLAPQWGAPVQQKADAVPTTAEAAAAHAVAKGAHIPELSFKTSAGEAVSLASELEKGPVVLIFYRGGWCPFCVEQLKAFEAARSQIEAAGGRIVAVSTEMPEFTGETRTKAGLGYPVYSDAGAVASRAAGVAWANERYAKPLAKFQGNEKGEIPLGATYVIDREGMVRYAFLEADYKQRATPDAVIEALKAIH